jgi:hypothetical protein
MKWYHSQKRKPFRIRSTKELAPGFLPRWQRLELRCVAAVFGLCLLMIIGAATDSQLVLSVFYIGGVFVAALLGFVQYGVILLGFVGNWFPWVGLKALQLERWLEQDLDHG